MGNFTMCVTLDRVTLLPVTVTIEARDGSAVFPGGTYTKIILPIIQLCILIINFTKDIQYSCNFYGTMYHLTPAHTHIHTDINSSSIPTSLTIPAGATSACFEGMIVDNTIVEDTESFTLVITGVTPEGVVIGGDTTVISIIDNEGLFLCNVHQYRRLHFILRYVVSFIINF